VLAQAGAQIEQRVEVTIKDFTFITKQVPLMPNVLPSSRSEMTMRLT
jgi:dihydroxyacid dehydratase/phosphogluconate dehydratase